ncbi:MAG: AI-2E family transporter [Alphaproteobacteria bacterium]|nr:MAG: AI-2E family transporter [Alphaproteobacteria bacterium]
MRVAVSSSVKWILFAHNSAGAATPQPLLPLHVVTRRETLEKAVARVPVVHVRGNSAIRRPLIILAVCAIAGVGYVARDFLIPTAGAIVLALILTPVANTLERVRLAPTPAAAVAVLLLTLVLAGVLSLVVPSIADWAAQAPFLTLTLQRKLEGLRKSLAFMEELSARVEQAAAATATKAAEPAEKVVVHNRSLLQQLASTTPGVILQIAYAGVLAFMLLAHRNNYRRQILRIPLSFETRVRLARMMRDINERVGHYLFSLAVIYAAVAVLATVALALFGLPNALMWGVLLGIASFVPFVGPPVVIGLIGLAGLLTFEDWPRIAAVPAILVLIHFVESQFVTPAFVSRRCALSTVAVFVAIGLLGWMWGAVGAIVAVPLLILISTIAAHLPSLRWLEVLLSDDRPVKNRRIASKPPLASRGYAPSARSQRQPRRRLVATR